MKDCAKILISLNSSIRDTIKVIDDSTLKIALVIDEEKHLLGTVTDGDIRRGLLRGIDLQCPVSEVMFRSPFVVPPEMDKEMIFDLMRANRLLHLPVVDAERRVVGLHLLEEIISTPKRPNCMVIMAGGLGKRLRPFTEDCPKPMLPVAGKPMLEHIIERARREGFCHFVLAIRYLGHVIENYFGNGEHFGVKIDYLREKRPLGTAGALSMLGHALEAPIVVTNGDVLADIRYGELLEFHLKHQAVATMAVRLHEWQHPYGVVRTNGIEITGFDEKPIQRSHVNAGVYVLSPSALNALARGEVCDMPVLFEKLHGKGGKTIAYPMHEPWLDVGRPEDLDRARLQSSEKQDLDGI